MSRLSDAAQQTDLSPEDLARLSALTADWSLLADLSFSDLVLWLPTWNGTGYVAGAQQRPTTGPTVFAEDIVGSFLPKGRRPFLDAAVEERRIVAGPPGHALVPAEAIPVIGHGRVLAVIARHRDPAGARATGRLESAYLEAFAELARMVADGGFPVAGDTTAAEVTDPPRVGDGMVRLDSDGTVVFASPNALSAYRRLGLAADLVGAGLAEVSAALVTGRGPVDEDLAVVAAGRAPGLAELSVRGVTVQLRGIPLTARGRHDGAVVLVRDVSEVRLRERELLSKDATIREVHHRVKNNLQTVASLLRLQARRLDEPAARAALEEAVRRVGAIAVVHETLSMSADDAAQGESVDFDEVADRVLAMTGELAGEHHVRISRDGEFGRLPAQVATPLSLVLNELVQNAVEHGVAGGGAVTVRAVRLGGDVRLDVADDGPGLPSGFDPEGSDRLGLRIVRTLVVGDLGGTLEFGAEPGGGLCVSVLVPLPA